MRYMEDLDITQFAKVLDNIKPGDKEPDIAPKSASQAKSAPQSVIQQPPRGTAYASKPAAPAASAKPAQAPKSQPKPAAAKKPEPAKSAPKQPEVKATAQPAPQPKPAEAPREPQYQAPPQPQYHAPPQPQAQYQAPPQQQYQAPPQPQYHAAPQQPQYQTAQPQPQPTQQQQPYKQQDSQKTKIFEAEIDKLRVEVDDYKGLAQRLAADFENYKKRNKTIGTDMYNEGIQDAIIAIMPVLDSLDFALSSNATEKKDKDGIILIKKQLDDALKQFGVMDMGNIDDDFDPNLHRAMMQVEGPKNKRGKIVLVLQKGYKIGEKILRYALVQVGS